MYPVRLFLKNGQAATIRPMTIEDLPAINSMHNRLSSLCLYYRYFTAHKPSLDALYEQMQLSIHQGIALIASLDSMPGEIIGMAYCLPTRYDNRKAEPAFLVEDCFQGQGLGRALFDNLVQQAKLQAFESFQLFILPENRRMFQILDQKRFPTESHYHDGMLEVQMQLNAQMSQKIL